MGEFVRHSYHQKAEQARLLVVATLTIVCDLADDCSGAAIAYRVATTNHCTAALL